MVADGHGDYGHCISQYLTKELPILIKNDINLLNQFPTRALKNSHLKMSEQIQ